ncbi:Non-heme dioxygenase N-terminal domain-containing protein [Cynara cardunculus var. scolymus]|uniref:gibberellin 3beta-dioxygenase n=1 Tax=Cynara cardunculus var. scolymus TaxID=59895 RepID=A0A103XWC5_CYNCS|nr:Non-heme dioxygenase N-terminal domain-containing protein [Cynara cardunculus var. scolymus]
MSLKPLDAFRHLDLNSVKELPDSYAWSTADGCPSSCSSEPVPVINLEDLNAIKHVGHACKTWGVFQLINHGIPTDLLNNMEASGRKLFSLPIQQKLKAARSPDGLSGYGVARISSFFPKLMWSEGFTIIGSPHEHAEKLWPQDYKKEMNKLANRLMWLILGSLGITRGDINWAGPGGELKEASPALQLNSYPACPDPDRAMGLGAHTDSTLLTILHQNNTSGLQVHREGFGWITVKPIAGALVVNVGDLLHILSNGLYTSVLHRAIVNQTQHRFSIAYLYGPPSNVRISPLSKLTDNVHPPLYRSVTWSEYLGTKAKHFNKALSFVRLCAPMNDFVDTNDHNSVLVG